MNETNEIVTFLFTLVAGGIIGFIISHFVFASRKQSKQQKEIDASKAELEAYKAKVNNHFTDSAELMGQVANSYQALYNHMADQSQTLLDEDNRSHFPLLKTASETEIKEETLNTDPALGNVDEIDVEDAVESVVTESNEAIADEAEKKAVSNEDDAEAPLKEQPEEASEKQPSDAEQDKVKSTEEKK